MRYRVLGALEAHTTTGPVAVGGRRPQLVLALLLQRANARVSIDRLSDALWGDEQPQTARKTVQAYVSRLRRALGDDVIELRSDGYVLHAAPNAIDAARFERLADAGRALIDRDADAASATLREALALWQGEPWGVLADEPALQADARRLRERRLEALEDRIEADVARGQLAGLVGELEQLISEHPLRERLHGQLLLALYRQGRQAEALATYARLRERLAGDLGIEPSGTLQALQLQILQQDPALGDSSAPPRPAGSTVGGDAVARPRVAFTRSADGTRLAWATAGSGPSLVRAGLFISHIEHEAANRVWWPWLRDLAQRFTYVRYDERGCGLSERDPGELSEDVWVADLHAVVEACAAERVALFGMSQGAALAVAYAAAHPERVSHLILLGGYAAGGMAPGRPPERVERTKAFAEMTRLFWEDPEPIFRRTWTMMLLPDGSADDMAAIDEMQCRSSTADMAARILLARDVIDVRDRATTLDVPTLVAHSRDDQLVDYANGVELASLIPGATLLTLQARNHLLLPRDAAWSVFMDAVTEFVGATGDAGVDAPA